MNVRSLHLEDGSFRGVPRLMALFALVLLVGACTKGEGVQLGTGQTPDPVVIDFPIAYIKEPLPPLDNNGDFIQPDARELITFNVGGDVHFKDRAAVGALDVNITERFTQGMGAVRDLEMAYDGSSIAFAMRGPVDPNLPLDDEDQPSWNIWQYFFETDELIRTIVPELTAEIGHDIGPQYLPDGRILFVSSRQHRSNAVLLDEGKPAFPAEDENQNEPAFVLHVMNPDGTGIEQISYNQSHDFDAAVMSNGQIVFSRWDHAGPSNDAINLYRMNPDGSQLEMLYGQESHATGTNGEIIQFLQPREMEDGRVMALVRPFTDTLGGGDLIIIDTPTYLENTQAIKDYAGMTGPAQERATTVNVTTEAGVPSQGGRYSSVFPIKDGSNRLMVSWSPCRLTDINPDPNVPVVDPVIYPCSDENLADTLLEEAAPVYGIWIYDPSDETQRPIVPAEAGFIYTEVVSADPRVSPPVVLDSENIFVNDPDLVQESAAILSIRSVYDFDGGAVVDIASLADPAVSIAADRPARFLRIVKAVSLPDEDLLDINNSAFGVSSAQGMKEIVGYSMIEPDGSVMMKVPANVALAISVLDASGRRITARHQNWLQLRPGQLLECNGCHQANSGISHGRFDAFDSAYAGAPTAGVSFPNTEQQYFVGDVGETMAEVRARVSCANDGCSSLEPSVNITFDDVWTDEAAAGRLKDASFEYSYLALTTESPTSLACLTQPWSSNCRIVINYEQHVHPLWSQARPVLDAMDMPVLDPVTGLPLTNNCLNCHTPVDDQGVVRVPAGQLELQDGLSPDEPDHFHAYRELLAGDNLQEVIDGALVDVLVPNGVDIDGNPIFATVPVAPSMRTAGANASPAFFNRFDAGGTHAGYLSDAEKKLLAEWLDVGAQYYNNPFDAPIN
jgi:Hydrazine synthase alpha subunit middle domain